MILFGMATGVVGESLSPGMANAGVEVGVAGGCAACISPGGGGVLRIVATVAIAVVEVDTKRLEYIKKRGPCSLQVPRLCPVSGVPFSCNYVQS